MLRKQTARVCAASAEGMRVRERPWNGRVKAADAVLDLFASACCCYGLFVHVEIRQLALDSPYWERDAVLDLDTPLLSFRRMQMQKRIIWMPALMLRQKLMCK